MESRPLLVKGQTVRCSRYCIFNIEGIEPIPGLAFGPLVKHVES